MLKIFITKYFLLMIISIFIVGCAAHQDKFDTNVVDQIIKGKSTKADVTNLLGEPKRVTKNEINGMKRETWTYSKHGLTTDNSLWDEALKQFAPMTAAQNDLKYNDMVLIMFEDGIVSNVSQATQSK